MVSTLGAMVLDEEHIDIQIGAHRYAVRVGAGVLATAGHAIAGATRARRAVLITDSHVGPLHAAAVRESCRSTGIDIVAEHVFPAGESFKTIEQIAHAYDTLLGARIERSVPVLALGGGVVGDMAGFVAATLLRGVPLVQIPTSLLAMVDASVGGKTGVNHRTGKNLIGAFHQPALVVGDPAVLATLPKDEFISGLAECIKHDIIRDAEGFNQLERDLPEILSLDPIRLTRLVAHNVRIKAAVVQADPFERGERAHLNFGHTFGHAIETVSHYQRSHGQCVALGMVAASNLAVDLGMLNADDRDRIIGLISRAGLPTSGLTEDSPAIMDAMAFDKKVAELRIRFILPDRIGHVTIRDDVPSVQVLTAIESIR